MCNLSETCIEMKIEKIKIFSYKKNFRKKNSYKKICPSSPKIGGNGGRPVKWCTKFSEVEKECFK